ncbi:MAG: heme lyase CcmF/NrfE family subunit [Solirubrobacterales bacterium]
MVALGAAALLAAFLTAIYALGAALYGGTQRDRRWVVSSRRAVYALFVLLGIAVLAIELAFARTDLSLEVVASHSSTTTPTLYKLTAMWGSQSGSLLLWAFVASLASSVVLFVTRHKHRDIVPWATAVLAGIIVFFTGLMLAGAIAPAMDSFPFERLSPVPAEGQGLNPLLRHPMMAIHPPMLYAGYVFFSIPFAFAIGALVARRVDASWIRSTRRFALVAWVFLSIGLALGARWSYSELGWGGYWAWDPVENAALLPWLTGTAFLHSIMVQERRGMLRVWNVSLIVVTFALALFGTFLVRSGILQSIHAFGESSVGPPILILIAGVLIGSTMLIISRLDVLRSEKRIDSLMSREAAFLFNNLILVGLAAVVFYLTIFPLISEAFTGNERNIGAPIYNRITTPLAIGLVLLAGIGPLVAWRRVSWDWAKRALLWPIVAGGVTALALGFGTDAGGEPLALLLFAFAGFTLAAIAQEFLRAGQARRALTGDSRAAALGGAVTRNRRRYGGYIVHVGIAVMLIGVAASSSFQTSRDVRLQPGEETTVGDFQIRYERATQTIDPRENRLTLGAVLVVSEGGERFATLHPSRNYYSGPSVSNSGPVRGFFEGEATSEVGRREGPIRDLWTAVQPDLSQLEEVIAQADEQLAAVAEQLPDDDPAAQAELARFQGQTIQAVAGRYVADAPPADFRVNVNPFVIWVWIGPLIGLAGAAIALWPAASARRRRVTDVYAARVARDLSRA